MVFEAVIKKYWLLAPLVALGCEALRKSNNSLLARSKDNAHWIHVGDTPRVGGICIFLALFSSVLMAWDISASSHQILGYFIAVVPIFAIGLIEDIVGGISAIARLIFSVTVVVSACALGMFLHINLGQSQIFYPLIPLFFVLFCLAAVGMIHGTNLIDGLNGLATLWAIGALIALCFCMLNSPFFSLAEKEILTIFVTIFCLCLVGFLSVNYPFGRVFLGDSGAYLIGFAVFILSALLIIRSPDILTLLKVSAAASYPLMEIGWTISRRFFTKNLSIFSADNAHLHSLVYQTIDSRSSGLSVKEKNNYASLIAFLSVVQVSLWISITLPTNVILASVLWLLCPLSYGVAYYIASCHSISSNAK